MSPGGPARVTRRHRRRGRETPAPSAGPALSGLCRRACTALLLLLALLLSPGGPAGAGEALVMAHWPSRGPTRAVVLALHGFGDAGDLTFDGAAGYWAGRGITTYAPDQRGFGANASRKQWPGVEALVDQAGHIGHFGDGQREARGDEGDGQGGKQGTTVHVLSSGIRS